MSAGGGWTGFPLVWMELGVADTPWISSRGQPPTLPLSPLRCAVRSSLNYRVDRFIGKVKIVIVIVVGGPRLANSVANWAVRSYTVKIQ